MKGVSPVVATVLIIAIAVIASVTVYYWVTPYTQKPQLPDETYHGIRVEACNGTHIEVRNIGFPTIVNQNFSILNSSGSATNFSVFINNLTSTSAGWYYVGGELDSLNSNGVYYISSTEIPEMLFTCYY